MPDAEGDGERDERSEVVTDGVNDRVGAAERVIDEETELLRDNLAEAEPVRLRPKLGDINDDFDVVRDVDTLAVTDALLDGDGEALPLADVDKDRDGLAVDVTRTEPEGVLREESVRLKLPVRDAVPVDIRDGVEVTERDVEVRALMDRDTVCEMEGVPVLETVPDEVTDGDAELLPLNDGDADSDTLPE